METNPFAPPKENLALPPASAGLNKYVAMAIAAFFAVHIGIFANYSGIYFELIRSGAMRPLGPLFGAIADIAMFFGVVLLLLKRYSQIPFLIAASGSLLASVLSWNLPFDRTLVLVTYVFGTAIAFVGWWIIFRHDRSTHGISNTSFVRTR